MVQGFVSRFNGRNAIIEDIERNQFSVERIKLPPDVKIGDFVVENPKKGTFHVDAEITAKRQLELRRIADTHFD
ncbi:MAG: DUF3006 family protein [Bacillota bacterium]|nr:DUF3006 family protein [Bacillota bacterium]